MASVPAWRPAPARRFSSAAGRRAVSACRREPLQRRNRLSRSRDFDAVYRHGRSVSTRFLTLYWFQREEAIGEPRLGFAVPKAVGNAAVRNRIRRQLREIVRVKIEDKPPANDYVLVVRQGLPEAVEANGHEWLEARVDEVLGKAAA
jgi:ribonuclease P protein component